MVRTLISVAFVLSMAMYLIFFDSSSIPSLNETPIHKKFNMGEQDSLTRVIVFSRDRALQLAGLLESLFTTATDTSLLQVHVLYLNTRSETNYREIMTEWEPRGVKFTDESRTGFEPSLRRLVFDPQTPPTVLFAVDDTLFVQDFSVREAVTALQLRTSAIGFSLRNGGSTDRSQGFEGMTPWRLGAPSEKLTPSREYVSSRVIAYRWTESIGNFGKPLDISASIYRTIDVRKWLNLIGGIHGPSMLDLELSQLPYHHLQPELLMFSVGCAFTLTLNNVVSAHRSAVEATMFDRLFADGYRIDVASYRGYLYETCHEVLMLNTIHPQTKARRLAMPSLAPKCNLMSVLLPVTKVKQ